MNLRFIFYFFAKIMDKYLIRKPRTQDSSPVQDSSSPSKQIRVDFNLENLSANLGLQEKISSYHPNNHDEIKRFYLQKDPCQPILQVYDYPLTIFFGKPRRFKSKWSYLGKMLVSKEDERLL